MIEIIKTKTQKEIDEERLPVLKEYLAQELSSKKPSKTYVADLKLSIKMIEERNAA